jgi:RNA polymerase sigma-70 factor (ECF subfamily)
MLKLLGSRTSPPARAPARHDDLTMLVARARRGETAAVHTFVVTIGPALLRVVRRMLGPDNPDVEDLTQEAAFNVVRALPRFRGECSVLHFSCRIAVQTAMNSWRYETAERRAALRSADPDLDAVPSPLSDPEESAAMREATEIVRQLIRCLPEPQAEALALHCALGYTVPEIAACTAVSTETVRSRLRLAKQALRKRMPDGTCMTETIGKVS